jgi:DNA polymerase (family 10)
MTRDELAETLDRIAQLLELKGENPFKIRAYRQGSEAVMNYAGDIVAKAAANELDGIPGIGSALRQKLHELAVTGRLQFFDDLCAEFPSTIFELFEVPGLGARRIAVLHANLGVGSIADLKRACPGRWPNSPASVTRWSKKPSSHSPTSSTPPRRSGPVTWPAWSVRCSIF